MKQEYLYYADGDGDTYTTSTQTYSNAASSLSGFVRLKDVGGRGSQTAYQVPITTQLDCYDLNASAKPGQTVYFATTRGTSGQGNDSAGNTWNSYDYNCSSAVEGVYSASTDASTVTTGYLPVYNQDIGGSCYDSINSSSIPVSNCGAISTADNACVVGVAPPLKEFSLLEKLNNYLFNKVKAIDPTYKGWYSNSSCASCIAQTIKGFCQ